MTKKHVTVLAVPYSAVSKTPVVVAVVATMDFIHLSLESGGGKVDGRPGLFWQFYPKSFRKRVLVSLYIYQLMLVN